MSTYNIMDLDKIAILIKKSALEFEKLINPQLQQYDLTIAQYKILKYVFAQPSRKARVVDVEKYYSMTHPTTIGLLTYLEKKGFIIKMQNPDDARSRLITLTEKAELLEEELNGVVVRAEEEFTQRLSKKEKKQMAHLLYKMLGMEE